MRRLLHQTLDLVADRIGPDLISLRVRMQSVGHHVGRQRAVGRQELVGDIHEEDLAVVGELGELAVHLLDDGADGIVRLRRAREDAEQQHLRLRLPLLELFDNQPIAVDDLVNGRIGACGDLGWSRSNHDDPAKAAEGRALLEKACRGAGIGTMGEDPGRYCDYASDQFKRAKDVEKAKQMRSLACTQGWTEGCKCRKDEECGEGAACLDGKCAFMSAD